MIPIPIPSMQAARALAFARATALALLAALTVAATPARSDPSRLGAQDAMPEPKGFAPLRQAFAPSDAAADLALGFNNNEPAIAVDPNNPLHIAVATYLSIRVSVDGGTTFLPAVAAGVPSTHSASRGGDSSLGYDSQGRLFWVYLLFTNGPSSSGFDIFVAQCNPNTGALLAGYPVNVTASPGVNLPAPANGHDKPWLAVDWHAGSAYRDRLHIVWSDLTSGSVIRSTFSTDQGQTWSADLALSGGGEGFVWPPHNTVAPNGDVYVTYHSQTGSDASGADDLVSGKVFILRSSDGGASYPQKNLAYGPGAADVTDNVQTQNNPIPGARFWLLGTGQAWVLADPNTAGRMYVVANDDPDNSAAGDAADVYITRSTDFGVTWTAPARIDSGPGTTLQVLPTASIDPVTGCISVHYYDNRRGLTNSAGRFLLDVFATSSHDGGVTFDPDFQVNDAPFDPDAGAGCRFDCATSTPTTRIGEYNGIAVVGGVAYAVWTGNTLNGSGNPVGQQTLFDRFACDPCTLTCPATVSVGNDADLCGATVNYPAPSPSGGCGVVDCQPPPGSFFAVGSTTVTCTAATGSSCSFTVTVNDTQPPAVVCPANIVQGNDPGLCSAVVVYSASASDNCPGVTLACSPASGSIFLKGTTPVTCTATDAAGNQSSCNFTVTVNDVEPPVASCEPGTNPSGKNVPNAGNNPASGQNPDGFYRVLAKDNCDPAPKIYLKDSASSFVAGPFANGNQVKITQAPGITPRRKPGPGVIVAQLWFKGDALLYAVDADGNVSALHPCRVPPAPK